MGPVLNPDNLNPQANLLYDKIILLYHSFISFTKIKEHNYMAGTVINNNIIILEIY